MKPFLTSSGNLVTSAKFLGSGMKYDNFEPGYPKVGNGFCNSFTIALKTLCKPLPILLANSYAPFHSLCDCLMWSCIFNLASLELMSGCTWFPY